METWTVGTRSRTHLSRPIVATLAVVLIAMSFVVFPGENAAATTDMVDVCHLDPTTGGFFVVKQDRANYLAGKGHGAHAGDFLLPPSGSCGTPTTTTTSTTAPPPTTTSTTVTTVVPPPTTSSTTTTTTATVSSTTVAPLTTTTITSTATTVLAVEPVRVVRSWDVVITCDGVVCTTPTVQLGNTVGALVGGLNAVALYLAVVPPEAYPFTCDGFSSESNVVVFEVEGDGVAPDTGKTVMITVLDAAREPHAYEACYAGALPFEQEDGSAAVFDGALWVGILPDCAVGLPWPGPTMADGSNPPPCVDRRERGPGPGDVTLVILAPPGDPLVRIG